jgi:hypothetical protein
MFVKRGGISQPQTFAAINTDHNNSIYPSPSITGENHEKRGENVLKNSSVK